jgi:hypothetical protein
MKLSVSNTRRTRLHLLDDAADAVGDVDELDLVGHEHVLLAALLAQDLVGRDRVHVDVVEVPTVRRRDALDHAVRLRQAHEQAGLAAPRALEQELQPERGLAGPGAPLDQVDAVLGQAAQQDLVEPGDAGRHPLECVVAAPGTADERHRALRSWGLRIAIVWQDGVVRGHCTPSSPGSRRGAASGAAPRAARCRGRHRPIVTVASKPGQAGRQARVDDQVAALAPDAQDALDAGAVHPRRRARVPGPAAAPDVRRHRVDVGRHDVRLDLVARHLGRRRARG